MPWPPSLYQRDQERSSSASSSCQTRIQLILERKYARDDRSICSCNCDRRKGRHSCSSGIFESRNLARYTEGQCHRSGCSRLARDNYDIPALSCTTTLLHQIQGCSSHILLWMLRITGRFVRSSIHWGRHPRIRTGSNVSRPYRRGCTTSRIVYSNPNKTLAGLALYLLLRPRTARRLGSIDIM